TLKTPDEITKHSLSDQPLRLALPTRTDYPILRITIMIATTTQATEKIICSTDEETFGANNRAPAIPASAVAEKAHVSGFISSPCRDAAKIVVTANRAITINDVATILCVRNSVKYVRAGTIMKPPPTPSMPVKI